MSKQPRGKVRIGAGNTAGARVFDVFSEVKVLQKRLQQAMDQKSDQDSEYSRLQKEAKLSAIQAIRSISNWFYWQSPPSETSLSLTLKGAKRSLDPNIDKLKEVAARGQNILKSRKNPGRIRQTTIKDEYWVPLTAVPPLEPKEGGSDSRPKIRIRTPSNDAGKGISHESHVTRKNRQRNPVTSGFPMGLSIVAMIVVRLHAAGEVGGSLEEHIGGSVALQVVNSSWLQVLSAGAAWYLVGVAFNPFIQFVDGLARKGKIK